jgi:peptide/nickel transport system ATP-binding protein/oligopeptide transport system ATP-binding protein
MIQVENVTKQYILKGKTLTALRGLSLSLHPQETLGLVGESGCGKSTVGRCLLNLEAPTSGRVLFEGQDLRKLSGDALGAFRRSAQMIFQDVYSSLNPRMTAAEIIAEPLHIHKQKIDEQTIARLFDLVALSRSSMGRFPHEFSGGQRQRIGIARALCLKPRFIVCDEPISALDVSVQAQIINLLKSLQAELGLSYLLISHDLAMVKYISHRIAVLYLGYLVEIAPADALYTSAAHPYTHALLSAIPVPDPQLERNRKRLLLHGEIPSPFTEHRGCPFASRCPRATDYCQEHPPLLQEVAPGHQVACHFPMKSK